MATQQATLRAIVSLFGDIGAVAECGLATNMPPNADLRISGFKAPRKEIITLPVAAADQVVSFTDAAWVFLLASEPFSLRLAAGETLLGGTDGLYYFGAAGVNERTPGVHQTSLLLTNPGVNEALIQAFIIEAV